jgi:hypothetical protein
MKLAFEASKRYITVPELFMVNCNQLAIFKTAVEVENEEG